MLVKVTSVRACPAAAGVPRLRSCDPGVPGVHPARSGRRLHLEYIHPVLGIRENASRRSVTATTGMNLPLTARSACRPAARPRQHAVVAAMAVAPRPEGAPRPPATGNASQNVRSGAAQIAAQSHSNWRHNGGSGAATTTSDCHGARLASSRDDEPSADFVLLGLSLVTGRGAQRSSGYARAGLPGRAARSCLPPSGCGRRYVLMTSARKSPGLSRARGGCLRKRVVVVVPDYAWDEIISAGPEPRCRWLWDLSGLRRELRDFAALP